MKQLPQIHPFANRVAFLSLRIEDNGDCGRNFYAYDPTGNKIDIWGGWPI